MPNFHGTASCVDHGLPAPLRANRAERAWTQLHTPTGRHQKALFGAFFSADVVIDWVARFLRAGSRCS